MDTRPAATEIIPTPRAPRHNAGVGGWALTRGLASPHRTALIDEDGSAITYRQLLDRATSIALHLRDLGLGPGDRVAYAGRNSPDFVYAMVGTHLLGGTFVPLNFRLAGLEFDHVLEDSGAAALIADPNDADGLESSRHAAVLDASGLSISAGKSINATGPRLQIWCSRLPDSYLDAEVARDSPAFILYTSGTTGRPKGVVLTHENVAWNCLNLFATLDITSTEVALVTSPLFHVAALTQTLLPVLLKGATAVLLSSWNTDRCFDLIETHGVTWMFGVPTMYAEMDQSERWGVSDTSTLRLLTAAGAPVPRGLIETFQRRGFLFCQGYGLTETAPGATFLEAHDSWDKAGSAGIPLPFTQVRCVNAEGVDVPSGERGELIVKGPNVMGGYWNNPAATDAAMTDQGWLRSGDIAEVDEDGYIFVVDRIKDMFISGGENVYPSEIEAVLHEHPSVQDVAVVGTVDSKWGEVGKAFVILTSTGDATPEELHAFLESRLARFKIPKHFAFVTDLPKTGSGKVRKEVLRATTKA